MTKNSEKVGLAGDSATTLLKALQHALCGSQDRGCVSLWAHTLLFAHNAEICSHSMDNSASLGPTAFYKVVAAWQAACVAEPARRLAQLSACLPATLAAHAKQACAKPLASRPPLP